MITTDRLPEISSDYWKYAKPEIISVDAPLGLDDLPAEWAAKVGEHELDQPYVYEVENVHLYGPAMVGVKNSVILDTAYYGRLDLWERNYLYFEAAMSARAEPVIEVECAFSACNVWSGNYFHWLLDTLPKFEALQVYEQDTGVRPLILVDQDPAPFVSEWLDLLGYKYEKLKSYHYHVDNLVIPTNRRKRGIFYKSAGEYLQTLRGCEKLTSHKLYVSRKNARTRRVVNEDELLEYLLPQGYACILPETMSIIEQIGTFMPCEWLIAPHGAGLANMIWSRKQPRVIELVTPAYTNPCCWLVAVALGLEYGYLVADHVGEEDLDLDINKVKQVEDLLQ